MKEWYKADLAHIHDVGFGDYALQAIPGILSTLAETGITDGLIVDLGCGSGLSTREFIQAGYQVLGIDISPSMIEIARKRVPEADFRVDSLFKIEIPRCNAVTSIGECFNYLFDPDNNSQTLMQLFQRIYEALNPGGLLIFDILVAGEMKTGTTQGFRDGDGWLVLFSKEIGQNQENLTRRIITFRQVGEFYRRDDEVHQQRLYKVQDITEQLRQVGFVVQVLRSYGEFNLPPAHAVFVAQKLVK